MKTIKVIFLIMMLVSSLPLLAQGLGADFSCMGKDNEGGSFEVLINNFDFTKEVGLKKADKICNFQITYGSYNEKSVAPHMIFNFENVESCFLSKKLKPLKKGFLKVNLHKSFDEAHVLIFEGHQPLKCKISHFNKKKLKNRINLAF